MPKMYITIGVPCSGKSTWIANQSWSKDCAYISTDKIVERYARFRKKHIVRFLVYICPGLLIL